MLRLPQANRYHVAHLDRRSLNEAYASGEGVLYTDYPPAIEGTSPDPDDDNAERVRLLECALELEVVRVVSGDSDLLELGSYMGIPILTPRELLEVGEMSEK